MIAHLKRYRSLYIVTGTLVLLSSVLYRYPPDTIVQWIGVENSYVAAFLIAATGGLSSFTSGVFYASVATLSAGGANPWLLGLIGGLGIALGDSLIFALFRFGFKDVHSYWHEYIERLRLWVDAYPRPVVYATLFLILGISPTPNDIIMFLLVALGFRYLKVAPVIIAAGITITTITALLGQSLTSYIF